MSRLFAALLSIALLLAPRAAFAATLTVDEVPRRVDPNGVEVVKRPPALTPEGVNRRDCEEDVRLGFAVGLTDFHANGQLEVWASLAGADCSGAVLRHGPNPECWSVVHDVPLARASVVSIPVRTIVSGAAPQSPSVTDGSVCGTVDRTSIALQFLYFEPGVTTAAVSRSIELAVDTVGPSAPLAVNVGGDGTVRWQVDDADPPATVSVYCASVSALPACEFAAFAPGAMPARDLAESYECGAAAGTATSFQIQGTQDGPFQRGSRYAFALGSVDVFGNTSDLSSTACSVIDQPSVAAMPALTDGDAGDGGIGCSSSGGARPGAMLSVAFLVAFVTFARRLHRAAGQTSD